MPERKPYFAARLGQQPPRIEPMAAEKPASESEPLEAKSPILVNVVHCPLCQGLLAEADGVYRCQGRCGARWLETEPGQLADLAALPFGICTCCARPQALGRGERGAVCPASGVEYLLLPQGPVPVAEAAPHGLCQCCIPPLPLIQTEGQLICQAKPGHFYEQHGDQLHLVIANPTPTSTTAALTAIDAALRRNSARLTVNGLFDLG